MSHEPNYKKIRKAVAETYTPEGQRIWWAAWDKADDEKRRVMELCVLSDGNGG